MPLIPVRGTIFENLSLVSNKELNEIRKKCSVYLSQMYHCQQCRADAIGLLHKDISIEFRNEHGIKNLHEEKKRNLLSRQPHLQKIF